MAAAAAAAATGAFGTGTFGLVFPGRSYAVAPGGPLLRAADATGARFVLDMGEVRGGRGGGRGGARRHRTCARARPMWR